MFPHCSFELSLPTWLLKLVNRNVAQRDIYIAYAAIMVNTICRSCWRQADRMEIAYSSATDPEESFYLKNYLECGSGCNLWLYATSKGPSSSIHSKPRPRTHHSSGGRTLQTTHVLGRTCRVARYRSQQRFPTGADPSPSRIPFMSCWP